MRSYGILTLLFQRAPFDIEWRLAVPTAKEEVRSVVAALPDDATFEEIQYSIYARQGVSRGLRDAQEDRTVTHEEARRRMSRWLDMETAM